MARPTPPKPAKHRPLPAAVITCSDSCFKKKRQDLSGPAVREVLKANGYAVTALKIDPEEKGKIAAALKQQSKKARLVVTTGGTGVAPRDVTPEATRSVIQK